MREIRETSEIGLIDFDATFPGESTKPLFTLPYQWHCLYNEEEVLNFVLENNQQAIIVIVSGQVPLLHSVIAKLAAINPMLKVVYWGEQVDILGKKIAVTNDVAVLDDYFKSSKTFVRHYNRVNWPLNALVVDFKMKVLTVNLSASGAILVSDEPLANRHSDILKLKIDFMTDDNDFSFFTEAKIVRHSQPNEHEFHTVVEFINVSLLTQDIINDIVNHQIFKQTMEL